MIKVLLKPIKWVIALITWPFRFVLSVIGTVIKAILSVAMIAVFAVIVFSYLGYVPGTEAVGVDAVRELISIIVESSP